MSNIYLKLNMFSKHWRWRSLNIDFAKVKRICFQAIFVEAPTHVDTVEFSDYLLPLNNQRSHSKSVCGNFYQFDFETNYDV